MRVNRNKTHLVLVWGGVWGLVFSFLGGAMAWSKHSPHAPKVDLSPVTFISPSPAGLEPLTQLVVNPQEGLQLRQALMWVKQTHPELRLARLKMQTAQAKLLVSQGAFDPKLSGNAEFRRYNNSSAPGKAKESFLSDTALSVLTRYGLQLEGGYRTARGDLSSSVSPVGDGGEFYTNLLLPLWRYRQINPFSVAEKQAILELQQAALGLQEKELQLQQKMGDAYWEWVASQRLQMTSQQLLRLGQTRVLQVQKRVSAGDLPTIANIEVQKEVQKRQGQVAKDTLNVQKARIKLSLLLWNSAYTKGRLDFSDTWTPPEVHLPQPLAPKRSDLSESARLSMLQRHPRLLSFPISKDIAQLDVDLAKQALLPKLDAFLSPSFQTGDNGIGPALKAGLKYELPLRNRLAKGKLRIGELNLEALDLEYVLMYQALMADLEQTLADLEAQYAMYTAATGEWKTAQALEAGERTQFELGDSTLFVLNLRERESTEAFRKVIESEQAYHQAMIRYLVLSVQI